MNRPDWDLDREYGEEGEQTLRGILRLANDRVEVKRKRRVDDGFYVETEQRPSGAITYKPSGIATTQAEYFAYVIADTGIVVLVPTPVLKAACVQGSFAEEKDGDNPTRGWLVRFGQLLSLKRAA